MPKRKPSDYLDEEIEFEKTKRWEEAILKAQKEGYKGLNVSSRANELMRKMK